MEEQNKLVKAEPQLVTVPTKNGNERLVARAADGKFSKRQAAATKKSIRDVVAFSKVKQKTLKLENPWTRPVTK